MYKNLPDTLLIERGMMHRMETTGTILQYLPQFLQTLARTKETASSVESLEAELKRQEKMQKQEMTKSIEWIAEKIEQLKTSPFVTHPLVHKSIARAEQSINSKDQLSPAILLHSIIVNLQLAVNAVAAFGNDPLSRSQLLNLIDTFLNMLDINITHAIAKRKEAKQSIQAAGPNFDVRVRDKEVAVEWMKKEWAKDNKLSQDTIVDRLVLAVLQNRIELEEDYKRSTFEKWVNEADPLPKAERVYRPKAKNLKNG